MLLGAAIMLGAMGWASSARADSASWVQVRGEATSLGWSITYDPFDHRVDLASSETQVALWIGSETAFRDGVRYTLSAPVRIVQGHVYTIESDLLRILNGGAVTGSSGTTQVDTAVARAQLAQAAPTYTGVRYQWGGTSPSTGFDCSGFIWYMFSTHGINIPRATSTDLFTMGSPVAQGSLQPGDLVFYGHGGSVTHVGIYLGGGKWISATTTKGIWTSALTNSYWAPMYLGARRI